MEGLNLCFFGRFLPTLNNNPLPITSHKTWALLAWLALNPDELQSRDAIATLLWPEHPNPLPTLRKALSRLRKQIPDNLEVTRTTVALVGEWESDFGRFQHALSIEDWQTAVEQYDGEFLAGVSADSLPFEEWLLLKREWLQREFLGALRALTQQHFANRDYEAAYQTAWRHGETDRFDEAAQRDIMRALAMLGRRNDALTHYEAVRDLLAAELAVEPAASTTTLRDQIAANELTELATQTQQQLHNLPPQNTPFIGRIELLAQLNKKLTDPNCRLLTLLGMGGMGKTRLAIALGLRVIEQFRDGVWFVPLATVTQAEEIVPAVAQALSITFPDALRESDERLRFLIGRLQAQQRLLILDNYEQIITATEPIIALLKGLPQTKIVVTSREALGLQAEWLVDVVGLPAVEAHELFVNAARRVSADFQPSPAIATIIDQVAGMPLALELAAGWVRHFSCAEIAEQIKTDIDFLAAEQHDLPERQRSMRAVFNYSWRLLNEAQRDLLRRLSIFPADFSTDAVREICAADARLLRELTTHSLVQKVGDRRFGFHPVMRDFSAEKRTAEHDQLANSFKRYYLLHVSRMATADYDKLAAFMQVEWENVLKAWRLGARSVDDALLQQAHQPFFTYIRRIGERVMGEKLLHDTLRWLAGKGNPETTAIITCELANFSFGLGLYQQGLENAATAYALATEHQLTRVRGKAAYLQGELLRRIGDFDRSLARFQQAYEHVRGQNLLDVEAEALLGMSNVYRYQSRTAQAIETARQAVTVGHILEDAPIIRITHASLALACEAAGMLDEAVRHHQQALAVSQAIGNAHTIALSQNNLSGALALQGRYREAEKLASAGLEAIGTVMNEHVEALLHFSLAITQSAQFRMDEARAAFDAARKIFQTTGNHPRVVETERRLGIVALRQGAWHVARRLSTNAATQFAELGKQMREEMEARAAAAVSAWRLGEITPAREEAQQILRLTTDQAVEGWVWDVIGRIALDQNDFATATDALAKATQLRDKAGQRNLSAESRAAWMTALHSQEQDVSEHLALLKAHFKVGDLFGTLDPIGVYVACLQVAFSAELAQSAQHFLNATANAIDDPFERHDYLHGFPSHVALNQFG